MLSILGQCRILITSFNEWWENTHIEPSKNYGFNYMFLTEKFNSDFKGTMSSPEEILALKSSWEMEKRETLPGFEAVFAIAGLLVITYLLRRRR